MVPSRRAELIKELFIMVRYGFVGLLNTGVFTLAAWLLHKTGWHYAAYTALAYGIAIVFSFLMNTFFTFRKSQVPLGGMFLRFLLVTLTLVGIVQLIQLGVIERLQWPELMGIIAGMVFFTAVGYILNRLWVFKGGPVRPDPEIEI
jgi:putative flippase GtrA